MNRMKAIWAVGTFLGLLIITLLALGYENLGALTESVSPSPAKSAPASLSPTSDLTAEEALQAWQQYSAELENTVQTMQSRENAYQTQVDLANQRILQMQDQLNAPGGTADQRFSLVSDDGLLHHEDHEEHEYDGD